MAFNFTWNAAFEALPADNESAALGAGRIRDLKEAISERLEVDHLWPGDATDGLHTKLTMPVRAKPTAVASTGIVYAKDVSSKGELFYLDEDDNEVQITTGGDLDIFTLLYGKADTVILAGDKIAFSDASDSDNPKTDTIQGVLNLVPNSSTTTKGLIEQATQGEVNTGTDTARAVVPSTLLNANFTPTVWCSFDGTNSGTFSTDDDFNVANITKLSTGAYEVNFTNNLANSNYAVIASAGRGSATNCFASVHSRTTSKCRINTWEADGATSLVNADLVTVVILGGQ